MFYNQLISLCNKKGIAITTLIKELGMSSGNLSKWKSGSTPKGQTLNAIARYFDVSTDYLLGISQNSRLTEDEELSEYLEELKNRSEMRMLFKLAKGATKEDVEQAVKIIEALHK